MARDAPTRADAPKPGWLAALRRRPAEGSPPIPPQRWKRILDEHLMNTLRPLSIALGILLVAMAVRHAVAHPEARLPMLLDLAAGLLLIALFFPLQRRRVPRRWAHPIATGVAGLVLLTNVAHLQDFPPTSITFEFALLILGAGIVLLSWPWFALVVAATLASWIAWVPRGEEELTPLFVNLVEATVLAGVVFVARRHMERRLEAIHMDDARKAQELERMAWALQERNRDLEAFNYSVSHDLRAPLRAVDSFSRFLEEDYADRLDDEGRTMLERVRASVDQMRELIDALLELSRVTRSQMEEREVDLSAMAQEVTDGLRERAPERDVDVMIQPDIRVRGDPGLLRVLLQNVLSNAWKYTSRQPQARIEFGSHADKEGHVVYWVRDNGIGFDMSRAEKLFQPFQRLHSTGEFEGTGVGLATVARIVRRHGGRVWAESGPGQGATFFFTLGSSEAEAEPAHA